MKVVIACRTKRPEIVDLPPPKLGAGTVLIRASHAAVALPEELEFIATVEKQLQRGEDGLTLGSMVSGLIEETGERAHPDLKVGLRVAAYGYPFVYHASYLSVPSERVVEIPKKVNHEEGAYAGQGAIAVNFLRVAQLSLGEVLLIFGGGMVGLLLGQVARAAGVVPIVTDPSENRLTRARNVGIPHTAAGDPEALRDEVRRLTGGQMADAAVLTRDALPEDCELAAALLREGGRLVVSHSAAGDMALDMSAVARKRLEVRGARGGGLASRQGASPDAVRWTLRDNMAVFLDLVADRRVQVSPLISDRLPLERYPTLFERLREMPDSSIGAILTL